jgi:hypothetical protein
VELEPVVEHCRQAVKLVPLTRFAQRARAGGRVNAPERLQCREHRPRLCNPRAWDLFAPARMPHNGSRLEAVTIMIEKGQADEQAVLKRPTNHRAREGVALALDDGLTVCHT